MVISLSGSEIEVLEDGKVLVIRPSDKSSLIPLFCPVCSFPMKTLNDTVAFRKHGCCDKCELYWSGSKLGTWKDGWRPSAETEDWAYYIAERKLLSRSLITLR